MDHSFVSAHCIADQYFNTILIPGCFHAQADRFGTDPLVFAAVILKDDAEFAAARIMIHPFQLKGAYGDIILKNPKVCVVGPVSVMIVGIGTGNLLLVIMERRRIHHRIGFILSEKLMVFLFCEGSQLDHE